MQRADSPPARSGEVTSRGTCTFRGTRQAFEGSRVAALDANAYYAVGLSGNGARIVVRDWIESTVPEIRDHVAR